MKASEIRVVRDLTAKQLKKMRKRYVAKVKSAIDADHSLLWAIAVKMQERGLYAKLTAQRDIRWAIMRRMADIDGIRRGTNDWHYWLLKHGFGKTWMRDAA